MKFSQQQAHSWFTLVELVISMTIFMIMSVMVVTIYFQATNSLRKLAMTRHLAETAREITERLRDDVRKYGIASRELYFDPSRNYPSWNTLDPTGKWNEVLVLGSPGNERIYAYGKRNTSGWLDPCDENAKKDPIIHCGLYLKEGSDYYNLVDSFIPEDEKKRVKIEDLAFYITGNDNVGKRVTLSFVLSLLPRIGVPSLLVWTSKQRIQVTFIQRLWKN